MPRTRRSFTDTDAVMEEDPRSLKSDAKLPGRVSCVVCYEQFINPNYDSKAPKWQSAISRVFYKALNIPPIIDDDDEEDPILSLPYCPGCHTKISVMYTLYSQLESIQSQYATLRNEIAFSVVESINNGSDGNSPVDQIRRQVYERWKEYHCTESAREDYRTCYGLDAIIPGGVIGMSDVNFDEDEELVPIKLSDLTRSDPYRDSDVEFSDVEAGAAGDYENMINGNSKVVLEEESLAGNGLFDESGNGADSALDENESLSNGYEVLTNGRKRSTSIRKLKPRVQKMPSPSRRSRLTPSSRKLPAAAVKRNSRASIRVKSEPASPTPVPVPMIVPEALSPILKDDSMTMTGVAFENAKPSLKRRLLDGFGSPSKVGRGRAGMRRSAMMKRDQADDIGVPDELEESVPAVAVKREPKDDADVSEEYMEKGEIRKESINEYPFPCYLCAKGFGNSTGLEQHISIVHPSEREFQCGSCNIGFSGKVTYQRHMKKAHPLEELATSTPPAPILNKKHPCPICKKVFLKKTSMIIHKKSHVKPKMAIKLPTSKKAKISTPPSSKKQRSRKSTPRASPGPPSLEVEGTVAAAATFPEECNVCFKTFQYPHLLKAHMVTHSKKPETITKPRKSRSVTPKRMEELPMETDDIPPVDEAQNTPDGVENGEDTSNLASAVD